MSNEIMIKSKDIEVGYEYSIEISKDEAKAILQAQVGEAIPLKKKQGQAIIGTDTITIGNSIGGGGRSALDKDDVISKINEQLDADIY